MSVRLCVCLCVCVCVCSLLRYRLTVFFPPLPEVGCPIFLQIQNPWGKVMERSDLTIGNFVKKWSKSALVLPYKTCISLILAYLWTFLSFCVLDDFFRFSKKFGFWVFLVHPTVVSVLLSASVERCFVSRMRDFQSIGPLGRCFL